MRDDKVAARYLLYPRCWLWCLCGAGAGAPYYANHNVTDVIINMLQRMRRGCRVHCAARWLRVGEGRHHVQQQDEDPSVEHDQVAHRAEAQSPVHAQVATGGESQLVDAIGQIVGRGSRHHELCSRPAHICRQEATDEARRDHLSLSAAAAEQRRMLDSARLDVDA